MNHHSAALLGAQQQMTLHRQVLAALAPMSGVLFQELGAEAACTVLADQLGEMITARIRVEILATEKGTTTLTRDVTVHVETHTSWWQRWKADHAGTRWGGWLARRYPPRTKPVPHTRPAHITVQHSEIFPHSTVRFPSALGSPVRLVELETINWADPYLGGTP